ncbi:hypothetical protein IHN32_12410 [Deinococcus sp. 14RED07]|uniref:hypothetical protein n=1 Tax=Deinococcus sp. 14RED07 TaxID=2745874 RepID=UPI001E4560FB|nr:hypothetical protein [Deinococcus sp. 14RED07]MCD0176745.1 hypothetical protein [Deinococcus sp. 14RED07]
MTAPNGETVQASPAQVSPPPVAQPATNGTTYIPLPIPAVPKQDVTAGGAIFGVSSLIVLSILARLLWRLPERMRHKDWVQNLGGAVAIQNRAIRALGYLAFVAGFLTNAYVLGILTAGIMMIAANTRPQTDAAA